MSDDRFTRASVQLSSGVAAKAHTAYFAEMRSYRRARAIRHWSAAWHHLERAHIIAQPIFRLHLVSHAAMLTFAISRRDVREILGQLLRIALVPLGALTGRLPTGNTGRARISAFAPMPMPEDLLPYLRPDRP